MKSPLTPGRGVVAALFLLFATAGLPAATETVIPLWSGELPGSAGRTDPEKVRVTDAGEHVVSSVHQPSLTVYLPAPGKANGAAVVVCPGGGHRELWVDHEGHAVARWLAEHGVAAFVLKYRLAREEGSTYRVEVEALADAQRALRLVRSRAKEWGVDPVRLGIMGFSAGGELAGLASRQFDEGEGKSTDPISRESCKPAFQGLIYPGRSQTIEPAAGQPPAFLLCGADDRPDISEGLAQVYLKFKKAGVPVELHIFAGAGHGFGLRATNKGPVAAWLERFHDWLGGRGFLTPAAK
ncbi:MAG TPA: alpha/beta hydrolase [Lacunisphaera sp.]|nr:alpha/beta hydrolase [Lacunisphaera sp.]